MKRPMGIVVGCFLSGILLWNVVSGSLPSRFGWPLLPLILACAGTALAWPKGRMPLIIAGLVLAGAANLSLHTAVLSPIDLRSIAPPDPALASIRGRLRETPLHRIYTHQDEVNHRTQAELEVEAVRWKDGEWQPAFGNVVASTSGVLDPRFFAGRQVEIDGVLRPPPGPNAPGGFDYAAYLRRHGIHYQLQCSATSDWRLRGETEPPAPLADRFGGWAREMLARGLPAQDRPLELLWTMTLGWRTALSGEVSEPFMRSGTMHVFAISGLHIALIAGLLVSLLRVCGVPRPWCALVVIPLLWLYTGLTGWQASAIRSTIMMSVIAAGWLITRPSDLINSLAAAALIILVWDPQQLFQAGFLLSFIVVLSLALLSPALERFHQRLFRGDPWLPDDLRPRWQRWLRRPLQYLSTSLAVSLAAWLGSLPLIAIYFNLLTPVSLVANLVVVPLSSGALACSLGSLALGPFVPLFGELFNHSAWFLMSLMIQASDWAAALPGGCVHVASPSALVVFLYYVVLLGWLAGILHFPRLRLWFAGLVSVLALAALLQHLHECSQTRLTILPMNGGGAFHLTAPEPRENWLIDCGDDSSAGFVLKPYLRSRGVNRLENLLITHGDVHHAGGASVIERAFALERVWFSPVPFRSPVYREAQGLFTARPGLVHTLHRGQSLAPWTVLHPADEDRLSQADDNAVVLLGTFGRQRVLLLSDLGKPGQHLLMSREPDLRADIVVTGIPSQGEPLADSMIQAIRPRLIIVADAEYPATQRASARMRERLGAHAVPVLYTRETGAVNLTFHEDGWTLETVR